jgi:hypothetical protein
MLLELMDVLAARNVNTVGMTGPTGETGTYGVAARERRLSI